MKFVLWGAVAAVAVAAGAAYVHFDPNAQFQKRWEAEKVVASHLKDPASAKFESLQVIKVGGQPFAMCGYVNGKNSFGAYAGAQRFYMRFTDGWVYMLPSPEQRGGMDYSTVSQMLETLCNPDQSGVMDAAKHLAGIG